MMLTIKSEIYVYNTSEYMACIIPENMACIIPENMAYIIPENMAYNMSEHLAYNTSENAPEKQFQKKFQNKTNFLKKVLAFYFVLCYNSLR